MLGRRTCCVKCTLSDGILGDLDLLESINKKAKCVVQLTFTTHDEALCEILEPNVCTTKERFRVLEILRDKGIPTVVWLSPILPFINDTEENLRGILNYCFEAKVKGIINFGFGVTLREGDREYFYAQLDKHFPGMKQRYQKKYGYRYELLSDNNAELMRIFRSECNRHGVLCDNGEIFSYMARLEDELREGQVGWD